VKSLALQAKDDFRSIVNSKLGAAIEIIITSPNKAVHSFFSRNANISQSIDPSTNQTIIGSQNVIAVSIDDLKDVGFETIRGVSDNTIKPWIVSIESDDKSYKVTEANPDLSLGSMVLWLEVLELVT